MATTDVRFSEIKTRTELADKLVVDVKALDLVKLLTTTCTTAGCKYPGVENNHGRCVLCQQSWFPRQYNKKGEPLKYCRGYGLYGPQFMRKWQNKNPTTCCCETPLCEEIGYSHDAMFALPTEYKMRKEASRVLGIKSAEKIDKLMTNGGGWVCPWHYRREHRVRRGDGWQLRKMSEYKDADGKPFHFPPPNARIQDFIDNEIPAYGYSRGGSYDDSLPSWVAAIIKKCDGDDETPTTKVNRPKRGNKLRKTAAVTPSPRPPRKRQSSPEAEALEDAAEDQRLLRGRLQSALDQIEELKATVEAKENELIQLRIELEEERFKNAALEQKIKDNQVEHEQVPRGT